MTDFLLIAILVMIFIVIFQIAKASEYVSVLKGEDKARKQNNKINAFLLIAFLVFGLIGVWWCNDMFYGKTLFPQGAASEMGQKIDLMLYITIGVTGVVFVVTQVLLFWFAFKYQERDDNKAFYFPHNTKLELLWTTVPAIFLTVLVVFGLKYWFKMTSDAPKNAIVIEVTGHQFGWEFRYPGPDGILGKKDYKLTKGANSLGVDFSDPASLDDIHVSTTVHVPVGKPVKFVINSQDVIHDVGLSHFRMKMDAVPGIPTTMWFTPLYTTEEMKVRSGDPNFVYEISCDQMCGNGHFSMRGVIIVESDSDYKKWLSTQKSEYSTIFQTPASGADSTKATATPPVAMNDKK
ncbi:MAG TPA: cytochrome c oxidase subunit II [Ferruginibacter sp.]|jgi:cytochrome c oxidase subunit 2|nr:cytochrome c oxidase subunit II [Ferruginibacter sp.]